MLPMHRILCTLMLLLVLASQALGAAHEATHVGTDPGECALCVSYGNSLAAPPDPYLFPLPVAKQDDAIESLLLEDSASAVLCRHQRGPPALI